MNALERRDAVRSKIAHTLRRGVRAAYRILIEPKSLDEDARRREFIFNVIVGTVFFIVSILSASVLYNELTMPEYGGVRAGSFCLFASFFGILLLLSRIGLTRLASYLFIGLYFLGTTYAVYRWSIELPFGTLSYATIIIISGIVISSRFAAFVTATISATFISIGWMQVHGAIPADTAWRSEPLEFKDTVQHAFTYASIMVVSWLANREITHSLARARRSEAELKAERDLLEQRVEERTRELKASQLEKVSQLYRFAEFGRLASGIYHDLLNPLTAVSLSVERLQEDSNVQGSEAKANVEKAIRASRRMDAFLQTVRKQLATEGSHATFSPKDEIRDAIDMLSYKARTSRTPIYADTDVDVALHGSPTKFFQIVVNLISNAIDAHLESPRDERRIDVILERDGETAIIKVKDAGCGIPKDKQRAIFEPFFTTKARHTGIGLGLSTTKEIVEKDFMGTIEVASEEGSGSLFTVSIPIKKPHEKTGVQGID